jgi:hypothetical protein
MTSVTSGTLPRLNAHCESTKKRLQVRHVRGILERTEEGVVNLLADRFETLGVSAAQRSRDFR